MKTNKFWLLVLGGLLLLSLAALFLLRGRGGTVANIYQDGVCLYSIDLSQVEEPYTITVSGPVENVISVEPGRICVSEASCPDQVCVHQGWISNGVAPVVCLPNSLVIQIVEAESSGDIDGIAG